MQFVIVGNDRDDALAVRKQVRPDHLAYWKGLGAVFLSAGPLVDDEGIPTGSLIIVEADSRGKAEQMAAHDPYVLRGVFENYSVRGWHWIFGRPELS